MEWLADEMRAHGVKPEVEAFDLSMVFSAVALARAGKIEGPLHVQFVMGVKNAMPVDREVFQFCVKTLKRLDRATLAPSNAARVKRVAEQCAEFGRRPATVREARHILGLPERVPA